VFPQESSVGIFSLYVVAVWETIKCDDVYISVLQSRFALFSPDLLLASCRTLAAQYASLLIALHKMGEQVMAFKINSEILE